MQAVKLCPNKNPRSLGVLANTGMAVLIDWVKAVRTIRHKIGHFGDIPHANLLAWYGKLNLTQQKYTFTPSLFSTNIAISETNTNQKNWPPEVASNRGDIWWVLSESDVGAGDDLTAVNVNRHGGRQRTVDKPHHTRHTTMSTDHTHAHYYHHAHTLLPTHAHYYHHRLFVCAVIQLRQKVKIACLAFNCIRGAGPPYFQHVCILTVKFSSQALFWGTWRSGRAKNSNGTWQMKFQRCHWKSFPKYLRSSSISKEQFQHGLKSTD